MKNVFAKIREYIPTPVLVIAAISALSGLIHLGFVISSAFADFFNCTVSSAVRAVMAYITAWIPFSLAEALIYIAPLAGVLAVVLFATNGDNSWRGVIRFVASVLSVLLVIYSLFVFMFAAGYKAPELSEKLSLDVTELSATELAETAEYIAGKLNAIVDGVHFSYDGSSVMPYSLTELADKVIDAYSTVRETYSFIPKLSVRFKPIVISSLMTYTHISGVYSFFTGEANVNTNYPDYVVAFTAAHELAHQRGIARENEANFIAYIVCISSDDAFLNYSGYLSMFEYLASALRKADTDKYKQIYRMLDSAVIGDLTAYSRFFDKYRESVASTVSDAVNDSYLKSQGTVGTASYGMVVDYAVAYHKAKGDVK